MAEAQADQDGEGLTPEGAPEPDEGADDFETTGDPVHDVLLYAVRAIVDHPDQVHVEVTADDRGALYLLHVDPEDLGRVIGRGGHMANAIRRTARATASRFDTYASVEIAD
ncbi:MAG TPA: KH domain-containing protein [Actinomycetota bacterium]